MPKNPFRILVALVLACAAVCAAPPATADAVQIKASGRIVFHDPDTFIKTNTSSDSDSLHGCRSSAYSLNGLRQVHVVLREAGYPSSAIRGHAYTDEQGNFQISGQGDKSSKYYVQVWTQDGNNRVDVHDWEGTTFKLDGPHRAVPADRNIPMGVIDFDATSDAVLRCSATIYAHTLNAYDTYTRLTGRTKLPGDNGHVSVTYGWGTDGMWTYWNNIRIESTLSQWDLSSVYHEFGHRIFFGADSPNGPLPFLDDATRFNYARSHNGDEVRHWGYAWSEGWADFNHAVYRPELRNHYKTWNGATGDGVNNDVERDVASKLLRYASQCGGGDAGIETAYKSFVETLLANPGPDLAADHRASSKPIHSFNHFAAAHQARTGCVFRNDIQGVAGDPIIAVNQVTILNMARLDNGDIPRVVRDFSTDGSHWSVDPSVNQALAPGVPTSSPTITGDWNNHLNIFTLGTDRKVWRASSADGGRHWQAWIAIGDGTFASAVTAVSAASNHVHLFGRGLDDRFWHAYSPDNAMTWTLLWDQMPDGAFTSAPAAAISANGKYLHVVGRGEDAKFWRAFSADGGGTWAVAWAPIGAGTFSSAPAIAMSADGQSVHVFGRGTDNKYWRAFSPDGGSTWPVAWAPIGPGTFTSAPSAVASFDGKQIQVFGVGMDNATYRAVSLDGGATWSNPAKLAGPTNATSPTTQPVLAGWTKAPNMVPIPPVTKKVMRATPLRRAPPALAR